MSKIDFASVQVGDTLPSKSLAVSQQLINEYADICGDYNSIHVDVEGMKNNHHVRRFNHSPRHHKC